jgi:hypothetical protein
MTVAKAKIKIEHPRPGDNETVVASFVAWGETEGAVASVAALVIDSKGKIKLGKLLKGPPNWGFRFKGLSKGEALLLVFDPLTLFTTPVAPSWFTVGNPPPKEGSADAEGGDEETADGPSGQVYSPLTGASEPRTFWADGVANCGVTVKVIGNSGSVTPSQPGGEQPPDWSRQFVVQDNPLQPPYRVELDTGGGALLDQHTGITVHDP